MQCGIGRRSRMSNLSMRKPATTIHVARSNDPIAGNTSRVAKNTATGMVPVVDPASLLRPGEVVELRELLRRLDETQG